MRGHVRHLSQRLSLRRPQKEALEALERFLSRLEMAEEGIFDFKSEFPQLSAFEREFPNVCFSLATGVGKTRLMGAMVSYLVLAKRVRNFLILAPSHTILEKLIDDFSNLSSPKYVFKGIAEFAVKRPRIITADNYEQGIGVRNDRARQGDFFVDDEEVHINLFNIAKMHTDQRKIKQVSDYLDESYFDYLASLEDLVVLMDEAHRYRASAAMKTINELKPRLGLEFTATPDVARKGSGSERFKNILYDYPLAQALADGFLKEPAIAGRENFEKKSVGSDEELDRLKIRDGIVLHEQTKVHLSVYAKQHNQSYVKPIILIVAMDTAHADQIEEWIEDETFFDGKYRGKVLVVHSAVKADAEEEMVKLLLEIERADNPIEIVVHVNMLREGWDIVNLYTMIPLRKANSRILIEQNLGRGLRLPYGKRTGIPEVDCHTIVSHDRFNEIVDAAKSPDSIIRRGITLGGDVPEEGMDVIEVPPVVMPPVFGEEDPIKREIKRKVFDAVHSMGLETKEEIVRFLERGDLPLNLDMEPVIDSFLETMQRNALCVPRIKILPKVVKKGRFLPFDLELSHIAMSPVEEGIVVVDLLTGERRVYRPNSRVVLRHSPEEELMRHLLDFDEVAENEENTSVVETCAEQMIKHLRSYLKEKAVVALVCQQGRFLAKVIYTQMAEHYEEPIIEIDRVVSKKMIPLKIMQLPKLRESTPRHFSSPLEKKNDIRQLVFCGFEKSIYPLVKFDSDSERIFSVILENDPLIVRWLKPARGTFNGIYYSDSSCYEPDFIVERDDRMYLAEVKRHSEMESNEVLAKAEASFTWCQEATKLAPEIDGKPWTYLLIPHDTLDALKTFSGLVATYTYNLKN